MNTDISPRTNPSIYPTDMFIIYPNAEMDRVTRKQISCNHSRSMADPVAQLRWS